MAHIDIIGNTYHFEPEHGDSTTVQELLEQLLGTAAQICLNTISDIEDEEQRAQAQVQIGELFKQHATDVLWAINPQLINTITDETMRRSIEAQDAFIFAALEDLKHLNPEPLPMRPARYNTVSGS